MSQVREDAQFDWDLLFCLVDVAKANADLIKGRFPRVEYWLRLCEDEAYRMVQGQSTPVAMLYKHLESCPAPATSASGSMPFIEKKLDELRDIASQRGLGGLAMSIERARLEAKKKAIHG
jgi:hypothetical protein